MNYKLYLFSILLILNACDIPSNKSKPEAAEIKPKIEVPDVSIEEQLKLTIEEVSKPFDTNLYNEYDADLNYARLKFEEWANYIHVEDTTNNPEVKKLCKILRSKVVEHQKKAYPILRKSFVERKAAKLWEENIEMSCSGAGYTTITMVGAVFASNKNIKEMEEALAELLVMYRFKRINFKWIRSEEEYTYYTYKSPNDGDLFK